VDFVAKFEKALRKRHHILMAEVAKIEHLIDAFEKGAKRGAKVGGSRLSAAARKKISITFIASPALSTPSSSRPAESRTCGSASDSLGPTPIDI
jgi:hypothetical protein